jgi:CRP/FNR family transcriptional regulator
MSTPDPQPAPPAATIPINVRDLRAHCSTCTMRELCLPVGLGVEDLRQVDAITGVRRKIRKGDALYRAGETFGAFFAVRVGSFKTIVLAEGGHEQVAGYHMLGDIVGMDGVAEGAHGCDAIALEDSEACVLPFDRLEELARSVPPLQHNLHRFLAREISRDHSVMLLLGSMRAEERVAEFLLNLSERYRKRGYSSTEFVLRMTREEIGSYLGLKLETVSRLLSQFQREGLIRIKGRDVQILDLPALKQLVAQRG